jgi:hypothetical protein
MDRDASAAHQALGVVPFAGRWAGGDLNAALLAIEENQQFEADYDANFLYVTLCRRQSRRAPSPRSGSTTEKV